MTVMTDLCRNHSVIIIISARPNCDFEINRVLVIFGICLCLRSRAHAHRFSVELELNFLRKEANASTFGLSGATHIEDMFYLFKVTGIVPTDNCSYDIVKPNSREAQMIRTMTKFITNFAKNG